MISLHNISIQHGDFALLGMEMSIADGEYAVLMGSTGCGKTTLLEAIVGLRSVTAGKIVIGGKDVTHLPCSVRGQRDLWFLSLRRNLKQLRLFYKRLLFEGFE